VLRGISTRAGKTTILPCWILGCCQIADSLSDTDYSRNVGKGLPIFLGGNVNRRVLPKFHGIQPLVHCCDLGWPRNPVSAVLVGVFHERYFHEYLTHKNF